ncbi:hypothetical protein [Mesorhizobium sp. BHbdii]
MTTTSTILASGSQVAPRFLPASNIALIAYWIVLPAILLRLAFTLVPLVQTVYLSFTNSSLMGRPRFIGLQNYVALFQDQTLLSSLTFTILYTVASN